MNCDGHVNWRDQDCFVAAQNNCPLADPNAYTCSPCPCERGDVNGDGYVNYLDIDAYTAAQNTSGAMTFQYDAENRLAAAYPTFPNAASEKVVFDYDYRNRRVRTQVFDWDIGDPNDPNDNGWATTPTEDRRYLWHGWLLLAEIDAAAPGYSPLNTRRFVWGLDLAGQMTGGAGAASGSLDPAGGVGGLLAVSDPSNPSDPNDTAGEFVYTYDANGNVGQLVDLTPTAWDPNDLDAVMVARYEYEPFGRVALDIGDAAAVGPYGGENPFRFSTHQADDATGLLYAKNRYYWPDLGRWTTRDPIGERGGFNLFAYVSNSPTAAVDPLARIFHPCS